MRRLVPFGDFFEDKRDDEAYQCPQGVEKSESKIVLREIVD